VGRSSWPWPRPAFVFSEQLSLGMVLPQNTRENKIQDRTGNAPGGALPLPTTHETKPPIQLPGKGQPGARQLGADQSVRQKGGTVCPRTILNTSLRREMPISRPPLQLADSKEGQALLLAISNHQIVVGFLTDRKRIFPNFFSLLTFYIPLFLRKFAKLPSPIP
jgi:hypothetical protein